jgi:hypothetical protein
MFVFTIAAALGLVAGTDGGPPMTVKERYEASPGNTRHSEGLTSKPSSRPGLTPRRRRLPTA